MKTLNLNFFLLIATVLLFTTACEDDQLMVDNPSNGDVQFERFVSGNPQVVLGASPDADGNTFLTNRTLDSDTCYILNQFVRVPSGVTLTIEAGTTILGRTGTLSGDPATGIPPGTLIIERGGKIEAAGTAGNPIVFTSEQENPAIGDWGGVVILGRAFVNLPGGEGEIEGIPEATGGDNGYGGTINGDNSGTLQYVRIEYAGNVLVDGDETNGLTLGGVGSGTTIDHVQVSFGADDGFEFFGGTVNASYLIASRNTDDDFDTDQGYSGKIQFGIVLRDPNNFSSLPTNGFESNGDSDDASGSFTNATFSNFTVIGPIKPGSTAAVNSAYRSGALIRDGSELDLFNSIIVGFPVYQLELETTADFGSAVQVEGTTIVFPTYGSYTASFSNVAPATYLTSGYNNEIGNANNSGVGQTTTGTLPQLTGLKVAAWSLTAPDFVPHTEKSSDFSNSLLTAGFFDTSVDFRGAFGASSEATEGTDWNIASWARF
ncbi:hypothetical protein [Marivirga lumbricoides]